MKTIFHGYIPHTIARSIIPAVLILIAVACLNTATHAGNFVVPATEAVPEDKTFVFPLKSFADGKARHFVYNHGPGESVRFFVVKSSDGIIRAAFDACDVCWKNKKGYVQRQDMMVCINCGMKFPTRKINETKGGCNPAPLARTVDNGRLRISVDDVLAGLKFFK